MNIGERLGSPRIAGFPASGSATPARAESQHTPRRIPTVKKAMETGGHPGQRAQPAIIGVKVSTARSARNRPGPRTVVSSGSCCETIRGQAEREAYAGLIQPERTEEHPAEFEVAAIDAACALPAARPGCRQPHGGHERQYQYAGCGEIHH